MITLTFYSMSNIIDALIGAGFDYPFQAPMISPSFVWGLWHDLLTLLKHLWSPPCGVCGMICLLFWSTYDHPRVGFVAWTANPFEAPMMTPSFVWGLCCCVFYVVFCKAVYLFVIFFILPWYCQLVSLTKKFWISAGIFGLIFIHWTVTVWC